MSVCADRPCAGRPPHKRDPPHGLPDRGAVALVDETCHRPFDQPADLKHLFEYRRGWAFPDRDNDVGVDLGDLFENISVSLNHRHRRDRLREVPSWMIAAARMVFIDDQYAWLIHHEMPLRPGRL